ncbi:hypothetical protein [Acuticoccus kandeliae]|uniref:hypothetical protein n=1 Tax=Acuticoccus kandeliae TaxID=2073160 RepID=UPI001FE5653D|nr:hypothetical protein [Acuticoccus kandeliae]
MVVDHEGMGVADWPVAVPSGRVRRLDRTVMMGRVGRAVGVGERRVRVLQDVRVGASPQDERRDDAARGSDREDDGGRPDPEISRGSESATAN